jgi:hypothetical protein
MPHGDPLAIFAAYNYQDRRSTYQKQVDRINARHQAEVLDPATPSAHFDKIINDIRTRQENSPDPNAVKFDRYTPTAGGATPGLLVARGEIVVRLPGPGDTNPTAAEVTTAVQNKGYTLVPENPADAPLSDPRTRVFRSAKDPAAMATDIANLGQAGIVASMNLIVPLGHLIKGDDFPSTTAALGTYPPAGQFNIPGQRVRVAIVDTGIDPKNRGDGWLQSITRGPANRDLLDITGPSGKKDGRLDWGAGHGTHVAGIVEQIAPGCEIVAYRYTDADGLGTEKDVAEALLRAAADAEADGVRLIINASVGTPAVAGNPPLALKNAVARIAQGHPEWLIVAAAGNDGTVAEMYPAAFPEVKAVGALTSDLQGAAFSNRGWWVDCSSVGVGVVSTFVEGVEPPDKIPGVADQVFGSDSWAIWSGTSFSAPQISGAVARLCQDDVNLSPADAFDLLLGGKPNNNDGFGSIVQLLPGTPTTP